ncbi:hypothetical protein SMICM17S_08300 [Streptomyces microflavus]
MHGRTHDPRNEEASPSKAPDSRTGRLPSVTDHEVRADMPLTPATADALQRSIGNAAVARMIEQERHVHDPSCGHQDTADGYRGPRPHRGPRSQRARASPRSPAATHLDEPVRTEMAMRGAGRDISTPYASRRRRPRPPGPTSEALGARAYTS